MAHPLSATEKEYIISPKTKIIIKHVVQPGIMTMGWIEMKVVSSLPADKIKTVKFPANLLAFGSGKTSLVDSNTKSGSSIGFLNKDQAEMIIKSVAKQQKKDKSKKIVTLQLSGLSEKMAVKTGLEYISPYGLWGSKRPLTILYEFDKTLGAKK